MSGLIKRSVLPSLMAIAGFEAIQVVWGRQIAVAFSVGFIVAGLIAFWEAGRAIDEPGETSVSKDQPHDI